MRAMTEPVSQLPASLSVSIVSHHSDLTLLRTLLSSLARAIDVARAAGALDRVAVTLVDNSCDEQYLQQLQSVVETEAMTCDVRVLASTTNAGFGASHNRVLKTASSDYHLGLNPDVVLDESQPRDLRQQAAGSLMHPLPMNQVTRIVVTYCRVDVALRGT